tara:strand:+ start:47574 stop:47744 length:171 start_codon:yes stop_codon:yes gene_type:complete
MVGSRGQQKRRVMGRSLGTQKVSKAGLRRALSSKGKATRTNKRTRRPPSEERRIRA